MLVAPSRPWKEGIIIKKLFALLLIALVMLTAFTACSSKDTEESEETTHTTEEAIPTEEAKVKQADAVDFIKSSYTPEELGLDTVKKDYSFMVGSSGVDIDGEKYIKVVANIITKNNATTEDGKDTFSMETVGEYYISFDAEKILKKDLETGEYSKLKNKYDEYSEKKQAEDKTQKSESTQNTEKAENK